MPFLNRSLKKPYNSVFLLITLFLLIVTRNSECVRYKERLKEGGLGNFLLGLAGSAVSTGIQSATGSPLVVNPAMTTPGVANPLAGASSAGAAANPMAAAAPGAATAAVSGAVPGATPGAAAGATPGAAAGATPGAPAAVGGMAAQGVGMASGQGGIPGAMGGAATPSALSFTTIAFGAIVTMMICMVMLMCRRCTKDDD
ncbi:unnamed protein product [Cryptosporidium hominis]|uniref:Uncharacterized protein n=1 Tax=Cryptosporidium hominis TaxID=237895 RepID=A0A0S4TDV8_CRYHO|nr:putative integral membrane protein [Cryptosporidium hominis]PPA64358.1 hypothetical protein ChUKH1_04290 [Cryptosporidium hominis]PPS92647.1 Uncharacterized protein GY17_00003340 [Cryptosporidium hominis]CUV05548.1 unnamed protein product [Cryptosporidium hominis]|eukprot:PPS92647.1 Uncharacterized protein GY17_00003340 [Cryptosporidium hominis]